MTDGIRKIVLKEVIPVNKNVACCNCNAPVMASVGFTEIYCEACSSSQHRINERRRRMYGTIPLIEAAKRDRQKRKEHNEKTL